MFLILSRAFFIPSSSPPPPPFCAFALAAASLLIESRFYNLATDVVVVTASVLIRYSDLSLIQTNVTRVSGLQRTPQHQSKRQPPYVSGGHCTHFSFRELNIKAPLIIVMFFQLPPLALTN